MPESRAQRDAQAAKATPLHLAVVVPVLNEAAQVLALQAHLSEQVAAYTQAAADGARATVLWVDGGSQDDTVALARAAGAQVLQAARGRARQMNAGVAHLIQAKQAAHPRQTGQASQTSHAKPMPDLAQTPSRPDAAQWAGLPPQAYVFLHADTRLPPAALRLVQQALQRGVWGHFEVRISGRSPWLRCVATLMNWRSRGTGIATGDQTLFMTRAAFEQVGGFADQPLMEDIALSAALKRLGRPVCLRPPVLTSGRRWEQRGVWRTILLMWRLRLAYWLGASPHDLARRYH